MLLGTGGRSGLGMRQSGAAPAQPNCSALRTSSIGRPVRSAQASLLHSLVKTAAALDFEGHSSPACPHNCLCLRLYNC